MKKTKIITSILGLLFLTSCGPIEKKRYNLEVLYTNGDTSEISYQGYGNNIFSLNNGDLKETNASGRTLISGVRSFSVLSIEKLPTLKTDKRDVCGCGNLQLIKE